MPARRQKVVGVLMVSEVRLVFVLLLALLAVASLVFCEEKQEIRRGKRETNNVGSQNVEKEEKKGDLLDLILTLNKRDGNLSRIPAVLILYRPISIIKRVS